MSIAAGPAQAAGAGSVGRSAPPFLLDAGDGAMLTPAAFRGKPLVLNVFASWCPPCRSELPRIVAAARAARGRVAFVGVDEQEPAEMAKRFAREMRLPYRLVYDHGQFAATYGVAALPATVFVDANGVVRAIARGAMSQAELDRDLATITPASER